MRNLKIGARLGVGFGIMLLLLAGVAGFGLANLSAQNQITARITNSTHPKQIAALRISLLQTDRGRLARNIILAPDEATRAASKAQFDQDAAQIQAQVELLDKLVDSHNGRELLRTLRSTQADYAAFIDNLVALALQGKTQEATAEFFSEKNKVQALAIAAQTAMSEFQETTAEKAATDASSAYVATKKIVWASSVLAALIGIALAWYVTRSITKPLTAAVSAIENVGKGDLSVAITATSQDETGRLLAALEQMRQSLVDTVSVVRSNAESVSVASAEIANGNTDLSQRTEEQAASLEETAASMEELTSTVRRNADNAQQASQLAADASSVAQRGNQVVARVVATMTDISESSSKIADITSIIEGIAFQTNILALNAAVEAARAGEEGRGFAVVASEVRGLAQRSSSAAKEIKELIGRSVQKIQDGSSLAGEAGETMNDVTAAVARVTDIMGEIASASTEQSRGIDQINPAVTQRDEVTQQNGALVEEAAEAAKSREDQSQVLKEAVAYFRLDGRLRVSAVDPGAASRTANASRRHSSRAAQTGTSADMAWQPR